MATYAGRDVRMQSSDTETPEVSVVIASINGLPYPRACLTALASQRGDIPFEVVLADCTGPTTVAAVHEEFPDVRVVAFERPMTVPALRAAGVAAARGRLVAVTEDHCVPRGDWIEQLVRVQGRTRWAAVGGGVVNDATERAVDWAAFFCEYHRHMSPVEGGRSDFIPGMNVAYDMKQLSPERDIFLGGVWENVLHQRLVERGYELGLDPAIVVGHRKHFTLGMFTRERYHYSRAFAGNRVASARWRKRLAWAAVTPMLPALLLTRVTREVLRRPGHLGWFVRSLPLIAYFSVIWSAGELVGYLFGPGASEYEVR